MTSWLRRLHAHGNTRVAWLFARIIVAFRPRDLELRKVLAEICAEAGDFRAAHAWLQKPLNLKPQDAGVQWMAGMLCLQLNKPSDAAAHFHACECLTNGPDILTGAYFSTHLDFARAKQGTPYYCRLTDVLLDTAFWSVMTTDGRVYSDDVHGKNLASSPFVNNRVSADKRTFIASYPAPTTELTEECILVGGDDNYSHWLFRNLLKLVSLEEKGLFAAYPWLVNRNLRQYQLEYLDLLGVPAHMLRTVERNQVIHCKALVVPALLTSKRAMTIGISWLRARLGHLMVPEGQADTLLYVSRADAAQRHILNEGELEDSLARLGFKSFVPGRCNVAEQIRAFSSARVIVGVHGAGMTNMVYAPAHASYIEIVSGALATMDDFRRIASAREQAMTTIVSESYALGQEVHANADYFVDVAAVVKAAQAALSRSE